MAAAPDCGFDRSQFTTNVNIVVLVINVSKTNDVMKQMKPFLFNRPKMRSVLTPQTCPLLDTATRGVLLSEEVSKNATDDNLLAGLPLEITQWLVSLGATATKHQVELGYELLSVEQVLRKILPSTIAEIPSSFETAGHVAHLNLREEVLPFKYIVAQVIIDKNTRVKSVVNKTASIATKYRTFPLEVLAGDSNLVVELKEGGASFKFDFRNVYWNSRLQHEHRRLTDLINKDNTSLYSNKNPCSKVGSKRTAQDADNSVKETKVMKQQSNADISSSTTASTDAGGTNNKQIIVADLMGGVGPFAIPLAQRGCIVHANDLNPESYKWLLHNIQLNKVQQLVHPSNGDAREFVAKLRGRELINSKDIDKGADSLDQRGIFSEESCGTEPIWFDHAIMNLPQTAIEFLDAFQGYLYTNSDQKGPVDIGDHQLPMIHVYCFEKETDGTSESASIAAIQRCSEVLEVTLARDDVDIHVVRYVSPQKPMLCLSFQLPFEVASRPPKF